MDAYIPRAATVYFQQQQFGDAVNDEDNKTSITAPELDLGAWKTGPQNSMVWAVVALEMLQERFSVVQRSGIL